MKNLPQYTRYYIRYTSAYTLIEILVSLTILGLIFAFGYVSFRDFSRRQSIAGASKLLIADLRLAQEQALSGQKPDDPKCNAPQTLNGFDFRVTTVTSYEVSANCSGGNVLIKTQTIESDLSLSSPTPNPITFKILGQGTNIPSGQNASVVISQVSTQNTAAVKVSAGGEIQ